jgi:hypothetical protein
MVVFINKMLVAFLLQRILDNGPSDIGCDFI